MKYMVLHALSLALLAAIGGENTCMGSVFYVDANHPDAANSNPGTEALPWKTIAKTNQTLFAGDTVYIKAGTYTDYIQPVRSGTANSRITYRNFSSDDVLITETAHGIYLNGISYITVQGIRFYRVDAFMRLVEASHNTISHCSFDQMRNATWHGAYIRANSKYNRIDHCVFSRWGLYTDDDIGSILDIGDEESATDGTGFNILENSTLFYGGHHVLGVFSNHNVIRNNYFHNENWLDGHGNRNLILSGYDVNSRRNLIQGNRIAFSGLPPDNVGAAGMGLTTRLNIVRQNVFYQCSAPGIMMGVTSAYYTSPCSNRVYSNTFFHNGTLAGSGREKECGLGLAQWGGSLTITENSIKNNIFHGNPTAIGTYRVDIGEQQIAGNWMEEGDPLFADDSPPLDTMSALLPDVRLDSDSPCVNRGDYLTSIVSPSGTGAVFQVSEAGYFMDGWGIVDGDIIQLSDRGERTRIVKIDYTSNRITVDHAISWTQGQGVGLQYEGAAPDIGAHEFQSAGPLTLSPPTNLETADP